MRKQTIIHVVGNRPQFVKLAMLHNAIAKETSFNQFIIHTGQHSSALMSDIFFDELLIPSPDIQLDIPATSPDEFIGKTSAEILNILSRQSKNDLVFVYGDTNSTLAAAFAARRSGKTLLHFESGVRTGDNSMPEEINRILTDRLSGIHYCSTEKNKENLIREGYGTAIPSQVIWSGDLMKDAFLHISPSENKVTSATNYIACTIHRASNITDRKNLTEIISGLNQIHKETEVIIPLHPHTAKQLIAFNLNLNCTVIKPLPYKEMKHFICEADYMITDSGGACREAFFAGKKSLIIMKYPFWSEIMEADAALHCCADKTEICKYFQQLKTLQPRFNNHIFGDGNAANKIAKHLNTLAD